MSGYIRQLMELEERRQEAARRRFEAFEKATVSYFVLAMDTHPEVLAALELRASPWWKKWIEGSDAKA